MGTRIHLLASCVSVALSAAALAGDAAPSGQCRGTVPAAPSGQRRGTVPAAPWGQRRGAAAAASSGAQALSPAPEVMARVGATLITRSDVDEVASKLLDQLLDEKLGGVVRARRRAKQAGKWTDEAERQFEQVRRELREAVEKEIPRERLEKRARRELLRRALVVEAAREADYQPDEVVIELRIKMAVHRAGGVEELERGTDRTVEQMREELRWKQMKDRFFIDRLPYGTMPGPAEIRAYYKANRARMQKPPLVNLRVIEMPAGPDGDEALERADALRRELQFAPDRFEMRARDLAKTEEEKAKAGLVIDPRTGEVVEWVFLDALPAPVARAVRDLKQGEVSDVVPLQDDLLLVKLVDLKPAETVPLQEASDRILRELQLIEQNATWREWCDYYLREVHIADGHGRMISAESFVGPSAAQADVSGW